jgi:hypothetical protein
LPGPPRQSAGLMLPGLDLPIGTIWWVECGFASRAAGVGPVRAGDVLTAALVDGPCPLRVRAD